jgi:L,D-transpeptidase YcbB
MRFRTLLFLVAFVLLLLPPSRRSMGRPFEADEHLRSRIEQFHDGKGLTIEGAVIAATKLILEFYERRGFERAWTQPRAVEELLQLISRMDAEGLNPEDYHAQAIGRLRARAERAEANSTFRGDLDILLTESLIRLDIT